MTFSEISKNIFWIEDIYPNHSQLVKEAMKMETGRNEEANYPGHQTEYFQNEYLKMIISKVLNIQLENFHFESLIRFVEQGQDNLRKSYIHHDLDLNNVEFRKWSIVIYLNDIFKKNSGTIFWEHKQTKSRTVYEDMQKSILNRQPMSVYNQLGLDKENWVPYLSLDYKPNCAVLFPAELWHSPPWESFGSSSEESRIIETGIATILKET